uniref:Uncharacterized protein n=1 Tax=Anguilla anguilla TaxID=7936 RepID=A0A0E9PMD8_ANGAN
MSQCSISELYLWGKLVICLYSRYSKGLCQSCI